MMVVVSLSLIEHLLISIYNANGKYINIATISNKMYL